MKYALLSAVLMVAAVCVVNAQEGGHQHRHEASELGRVNFLTTCTAPAQKQFNRAVAWLHSFEYEEAEKAFSDVAATDPRCGIALWGVAMTSYHPLWAAPTADDLKHGWNAIQKAKAIGAKTQRERDYINALELFYKDSDKLDHRTRTFAYHEAMKRLYTTYPSDQEAGVFYALTLIATGTMVHDKTYAREKEAAQILKRVLAKQPQHPGVAHYLIHSYDYPPLAELALPAARSYAKIAPASSHAQHMPSHIFIRLGLWQEAIQSNLDAEASAKAFAARNKLPGAWEEQLHAMDYLAYAYLQTAQDKQALGVLTELQKIKTVDPQTFKAAYSFAAIPARYVLERKQWNDATNLTLPQNTMGVFPWQNFRWAEAHIHFARALGFARTGNLAPAREELGQLAALRDALAIGKGEYDWAKQVDIQRQIVAAWVAYAEGKTNESLQMMRAVADLDDATDKHPVTPGAILPAREQLGELLLALKQPEAALREFEISLQITPERFNSVYGAARAATLAANDKKARTYYEKLIALTQKADTARPEIGEAKAFLAVMPRH